MGIGVVADEKLDVDGNLKVRGNIILNDNGDGKVLIGKNDKYNATVITGAINIDKDGITTLNDEIIKNNNISNNAEIEISKTLLNVDKNQMTLENNKITIKDVYLKKNETTLLDDSLTIVAPSQVDKPNAEARIKIYNPINPNKYPSLRIGNTDAVNWELYQSQLNLNFGIYRYQPTQSYLAFGINALNGHVGIGYKTESRTFDINDMLSVNGNIRAENNLYAKNMTINGDGVIENLTVKGDFEIDNNLIVKGKVNVTDHVELGNDLSVKGDMISDGDLGIKGSITCKGDSITFGNNAAGAVLLNDGFSFKSTTITGGVSINSQGVASLDLTNKITNKDVKIDANIDFSKISMDVSSNQMTIDGNKLTINNIYVNKKGDSTIDGNIIINKNLSATTGVFNEGIVNKSNFLSMKTNTPGYLMMGDGAGMKPTKLEGDLYLVEDNKLDEQEIAPGIFVTKKIPYQKSTLINGVIQDYHINDSFNLGIKQTNLTAGYGLALDKNTGEIRFSLAHIYEEAALGDIHIDPKKPLKMDKLAQKPGKGIEFDISKQTINVKQYDDNENISIGFKAGWKVRNGKRNISIGNNALEESLDTEDNIAIGSESLNKNTLGDRNVAIGTETLKYNESGNENIGIGYKTLNRNTIGMGNVAIGSESLLKNTEGNNNVALGTKSLEQNTSGKNNFAVGENALNKNLNGENNIAIGLNSLSTCVSSFNNIALGHNTLSNNKLGNHNIAIGYNTLLKNTSGNHNVAMGYEALKNNINGNDNIAWGHKALQFTTEGNNNIAIGKYALNNTTSGENNIALGTETLLNNTEGYNNIALGTGALKLNDTGYNNIAMGAFSMLNNNGGKNNIGMGEGSLKFNTTGSSNVAMGVNNLASNTTGTNNVGVGFESLRYNISGLNNVAQGVQSQFLNKRGNNNVSMGARSLYNNQGDNNIGIGFSCGTSVQEVVGAANLVKHGISIGNQSYVDSNYSTAIGYKAKCTANATQSIAIGYKAVVDTPNTICMGNTSSTIFLPGENGGRPSISVNVNGTATTLEDYINGLIEAAFIARGL